MVITTFKPAKAIVGNYTFAPSTGNYLSITGTTLFTGTWDDGSSALLTIPFSFTYNNAAYTTVGVNANGFITMGAVPSTVYCGLQTSAANSIAGYGTDLVGSATSTIQYTTRGTTPNRQFVVQWADCDHYNNGNANHWTFQIILNETSNTVQVVWGASTDVTTMGANACADAATESGNVGLLGASTQDFNIRSVTNGTNTWATSVAGSAITAVCNMSSTNIPSSGLTYTWTPAPSVPMSYVSSTTVFVNSGQAVSRSTASNQILKIQVVTSGSLSPFNLTSIVLSTAGCTNPATDITNAKVYFTGLNNVFSATTQFGSTATSPNGAYTVNGSAALSEGTNYFWVTYDITSIATIGNILSGCCTQLVGSGTMGTRTPSVTCPTGSQTISQVGSWTLVASTPPHSNGGEMLLLSDGTVLCKTFSGGSDGYGNLWDKLTPNASGSYVNGTWSTIAPMINTRLYFSSQILKDGRVYIAGGEYGTGLQQTETYNPLTNVWTAAPSPGVNISDANSEILPDGRVLQALVAGSLTGTNIYNPTTNTYVAGPTALGIHNESAWIKLPDNSILYVNRLSTSSERYIPSTNTWVNDAVVPVQLYDPFGDETGGALLLPDGRAFFIGSLGHTAYYTPSGSTSPGIWAAGPDVPSAKGAPDAPMAMMVNGKILCAVSPVPTSANHFPPPTSFYEFDYLTNTFTLINAPGGGTSINVSCYVTNMLDLPDGTVLYARQSSSQYYVYTPGSGPLAAGKPTIANIAQTSCTTFSITGTLFNGISQGACYGDDWQMATNYPLVRLTSGSNVYYARTANWNRTGVMTGALADTAQFTTPAGLAAGTYSLVVVANGISSDPVSFVFSPVPTLSSSLTPPAICTNTAFTYTPTSTTSGATFTWTRAAVAGISNAAITIPQTSNPNEVLINTTSNPVSVVYSYTISASGCSGNSQSVTVVVNPIPVATTITTGSATTFCNGGSVLLIGNNNGGTWSVVGGTTSTLTATISGDYFVTNSNSCGSAVSNHIIVTVNPNPTPFITGNTSFCYGNSTTLNAGSGFSSYNWSTGATTQTISASTAGTFTVTVTSANGCSGSTSATTIVNANPTPSISGNTSFCSGSSTTLNAGSGFSSYNWSTGATTQTISASTTGTYTVTVTNANDCSGSTSVTTILNANPTPSISGITSFCTGSSTTLDADTGFSSYSWSTGATTQAISINSAGTFTVTVTNANGCSGSASVTTIVNALPNVTAFNVSGCAGTPIALSGTPAGGTWSVANPYPGSGTTYTHTYTDGNGCTNTSAAATITVNALPTVSFSGLAASYSVSAAAATLIGSPSGGIFSGPGISGNTFTPSAAGVGGPYIITYSYTNGNGCTNSSSQQTTVTNCTVPAMPGSITSIGGAVKICPGDSKSYKITAVAGATSYTWTTPTGGVITSGQGTVQIAVTYNVNFTVSGTLSVTANNSCGSSVARTLTITRNTPATPGTITGLAAGVCSSSGVPYSVVNVAGITYNWSFNVSTASVGTGQGSNAITANYLSTFTTGHLAVTASNACGTSA
ncbi:MAG: PKD-like domain-containing protein, partial [Bacteroidota bacterium]